MTPSEQALALLRRFEGFSATAYTCPAGRSTIGFGHAIRAEERFPKEGITRREAEALLRADAIAAGDAVHRYIKEPLSQNQFDALACFVFNIGAGAFARSTLKAVVNRGWHAEVPPQLMRWVHAGGRRLAGLEKRRAAEALLYAGNKL